MKPLWGIRFIAILVALNAAIGFILFTAALALALAGKRPPLSTLFIPAVAGGSALFAH
jgi:hypothetical protein